MNKFLLAFSFIFSISFTQAQYCSTDGRFSNIPYFSMDQISIQSNIRYGNAVNWLGNNEDLTLDAYYPTLASDSLPLRPLIMMIHGGGLISGDKINYTRVCTEFAKRGFVAVSINYRLGLNCLTDSISEEKAKYRAQQDVHAAFRFIVQNAPLLRIDTSWLFIGGGSAGSVASLGTIYLNQAEWNAFTPGIETQLGSLYTSGNTLRNSFSIKGIFNDWGAMLVSAMQVSEMLPTVSFHGDMDPTVNIDSSFGGGCIHLEKSYGSRAMHQLLTNSGVCSDLSVKSGGDHGVFDDSLGVLLRVGRGACFFRSLFCNNCSNFYQVDSVPANCYSIASIARTPPTKQLIVYPNPFTDKIKLSELENDAYYILSDAYGKILYAGNSIHDENFSALSKGLYFLQTKIDQTSYTNKLIKE